jgi:NADPH-dependent 2,4-dienoyl-CoA reductase/sulfur reductase-like enzyme/nitrite reductase/ring-hydroxylating ferredoxin subunit
MQAISKRLLRFKKLATSNASFAKPNSLRRTTKWMLPAMGFTSTAFYMVGQNKLPQRFGFSTTVTTTAEEEHKMCEITGHEGLSNGQMMALKVGLEDGDKILIAKYQDKIYALSNFCSHFGVPLAGSILFDDKVICPAHNAAFSIIDGYPEHAPAKNGLQTFEVTEEGGKLFVKVPSNFKDSQVIHMATRDEANKTRIVIVGGGPAGLSAAETLRQSDFTGEIIILSDDGKVAYDRTLLSKSITKGDADNFILRKKDFLDQYSIDFRTGSKVKKVNVETNEVTLADDSSLTYDKLLLATGGYCKRPIIPGIDLKGVHTLRSAHDHATIKEEVNGAKKVIIVGASFIGYEVAAAIVSTQKDQTEVHVIDMTSTPLERILGPDVGKVLQRDAEEGGVHFHLNNGIKQIIGVDGKATGVELSDGTVLDADVIVLGTGVQPSTQYIQEGIEMDKDGSITVDPFLRTSNKNVYAAGDIANYPYHVTGGRVRVEHWNHASQQGEIAAYNMLEKDIPYDIIPFFWTRNYNKTLSYTGYHRDVDEVYIDGSLEESKFVAYYIKNDKVHAAAAFNSGLSIHIIKEAMRLGMMPSASQIKDKSVTVQDLAAQIKAKPGASACHRQSCCSKKKGQ